MSLKEQLQGFWGSDSKKVTIIGIGSSIRGDEAAPLSIIRELQQLEHGGAQLINADTRPENFTSEIRWHNPEYILFIQTSSHGGKPGETMLTGLEAHGEGLHESPLTTLAHYLKETLKAESRLLRIEPKITKMGELSSELQEASKKVAETIAETLAP